MFTGLVEEVGTVAAISPSSGGARVRIRADRVLDGLAIGDSIAVDGACLTAVALHADGFELDVVAETLGRTALGSRVEGDRVNLERALRAGDRLGGHLVQGHVDGTATIAAVADEAQGRRLSFTTSPELLRYVVAKGSVAIDGVSLTVASRHDAGFEVALIPHTLGETTLGAAREGQTVNLEVDLVAKYVEALVAPYRPAERDI
jgi:riboflavin synthase